MQTLSGLWYHLIEVYSNRDIKFDSDRIPALAGITSEFAKLRRDRPLFGLWTNDLQHGILFHQDQVFAMEGVVKDSHKPMWQYAPSWSWLALNQPVRWLLYETIELPMITKICDVQPPSNCMPTVLRLGGMLMPLSPKNFCISMLHIKVGREEKIEPVYTVRIYPDLWFLSSFKDACDDANESESTRAMENAIHALCAVTMVIPTHLLLHEAYCLLFYAEPELENGFYRRVGAASMYYLGATDPSKEDLMNALRACQTTLPNTCYHGTDGNGNYSISVV